MDRIHADQIIRPKPSCETRKGKNQTKALHSGIEDFICCSSFVDIETFYAGKQTEAKQITGRVGEQEWPCNALIRSYSPSQRAMTWKEKNATAGRALNGTEDDFFSPYSLMC